jgi:DNA ligase D-like protein (predicted 3'-phosphoesterase)
MFVIQKHDARRLHYDFRLESKGVLKSWAVPKGPSTYPKDKHLAILVEDHPMSYARFEGRIPDGEYGGGPVIVWDIGTYRNLKKKDGKEVPFEKAFRQGHVEIEVHGKKLKGGYAFTKFQGKNWLLVKMRDQFAKRDDITKSKPRSVLSKKTLVGLDRAYRKKHPKKDE